MGEIAAAAGAAKAQEGGDAVKIVSWNVNGLRSIVGKGLDAYLAAEGADIVCLQEVKATAGQLEGLWQVPEGYHAYWNAAERKGYSGTLVLTRERPLAVRYGIGEPEGDAEGRVLTLEYPGLYLVGVYTPNARGDLARLQFRTERWDPAFRAHCVGLAADKPVVFCGDLNVAHEEIDLARPAANRGKAGFTDAERAEFGRHLAAGFVDSYRYLHPQTAGYSWWSYRAGARARNIGWRIDYVLVSEGLCGALESAFIRAQVQGSDHAPVGVELALGAGEC